MSKPKQPAITIQETGKRLKLHTLLSVILMLTSIAIAITDESFIGYGVIGLFVGIVWYLITRFRIWWNHN